MREWKAALDGVAVARAREAHVKWLIKLRDQLGKLFKGKYVARLEQENGETRGDLRRAPA